MAYMKRLVYIHRQGVEYHVMSTTANISTCARRRLLLATVVRKARYPPKQSLYCYFGHKLLACSRSIFAEMRGSSDALSADETSIRHSFLPFGIFK